MVEHAIVAYLKVAGTITAYVSTRIYYVKAPQEIAQSSLPYITVQKVSQMPSHSMGGDTGWLNARIQITCHSKDYMTGKQCIKAIRDLFEVYVKGTSTLMGSVVWVQAINVDNEIDLYDYESEWHSCAMDSFVMYQE